MNDKPTLQERRIRFAFDVVKGWSRNAFNDPVQRAKGLPVQLRTQGLVVTLATLMDGGHAHFADTIARWLLREAPCKPLAQWAEDQGSSASRLLAACVRADRSAYLSAQAEALALVEHIKRFAGARLD